MNIYIGNLDFKVNEDDLRSVFEDYGDVAEVNIITDKYSGRSKGFGFIVMEDTTDANKAIAELNGKSIGERQITVNEARERK